MARPARWMAVLVAVACFGAPLAASASGSYRGRPGGSTASADRARYELGKKIFLGEFDGASGAETGAFTSELEALQAKLPRDVRGRVDLPTVGANLSAEQLEALRFFLLKRYKVRR